MRILLSWAGYPEELLDMMQELKNYGHEITYWVGGVDGWKKSEPSGTVFHFYGDAMVAKPSPGVDVS